MNQYSSLFFFLVFRCGWCTAGYNRTGIHYNSKHILKRTIRASVFESFVTRNRLPGIASKDKKMLLCAFDNYVHLMFIDAGH